MDRMNDQTIERSIERSIKPTDRPAVRPSVKQRTHEKGNAHKRKNDYVEHQDHPAYGKDAILNFEAGDAHEELDNTSQMEMAPNTNVKRNACATLNVGTELKKNIYTAANERAPYYRNKSKTDVSTNFASRQNN